MNAARTLAPSLIKRNAFNHLRIEYKAKLGELLVAGAITPELLASVPRGKTRVDADGDRCILTRVSSGLIEVQYHKPEWRAWRLPGVTDWLAREIVSAQRPAPLTDAQRENAIARAYRLLVGAHDRRCKLAAWDLLTRLIYLRSPHAVSRLEGTRGLVERRAQRRDVHV
jgi:hypothetical protein